MGLNAEICKSNWKTIKIIYYAVTCMAKIISESGEVSLPDGSPIKDACEKLGVPFGCKEGICGTCYIEVVEGMENLSELTQAEEDMAVEENHRLACQCSIRKGIVRIRF